MVSTSTTPKIDLSKVTYFKNKDPRQIDQAKSQAVDQLSHTEMLSVVTGFIDKLIQSGVDKLKADAKDTGNPEAQKAAKSLDEYKADGTVTSFKGEVADELAKNIYAVQHLLIKDDLANPDGKEMTFRKKDDLWGSHIVSDSAKELTEQTLASIHTKLFAYGIKVNAEEAAQLKQVITRELKKPPGLKSETPEVTTQVVTETTSDASQSDKASTSDYIEKFVKNIQQASPALANLSKSREGLEVLSLRIDSISEEAGGTVDKANLEKFQNSIFPNLADEKKFTAAVSKLSQDEKAALKTILCAVHGQADKDITCNEMSVHARNINEALGANSTSLKNINEGIDKLVKTGASDTQPNTELNLANLKKVNQLLVTFEEELTKANKLSSAAEKVTAREEAQTKLLSGLKSSLETNLIDVADLKMLKEVLAKPDSANSNYNERANKFLKDLNISTDDLKQWGSMAAMLAVGLMIFCPRAITGVMQAGTGLLNMTFGNGMLPLMLMNHFGGDTKQGMNPLAAMMMMRNNNQSSKAA
ncbi:MAG: hypothetical protein ACOYK1_06625 [Vampirovibrionia bacterium]